MIKRILLTLALLMAGQGYAATPVQLESLCTVSDCTIYNQAMVHTLTGTPLNFSWACTLPECSNATNEYVLELRRFPPVDTDVAVAKGTFSYTASSWVASLPRAGVYYLRGMSCLLGKRSPADCTAWVNSYDPDTNNPVKFPRGFVIEVKVKPPTF